MRLVVYVLGLLTIGWSTLGGLPVRAAGPAGGGRLDAILLEAAFGRAGQLPRLHSLLVWRDGVLLRERYFGVDATRPANIKSASKSVLSALVGIAIREGFLGGIDDTLATFFAEHVGAVRDARVSRITVEDLLTMRAGLRSTSSRNYGAWVTSPHWVRHILTRPLETEPGEVMTYSTGNTHLLSAILTKATGMTTWAFANRYLGQPLGITLPPWPRDPQGIYFGGNDMLLTPRDMLAFGVLYLHGGRAGGRQIVPSTWVQQSVIGRTRSRWSGAEYGYGWWLRALAGYRVFYAWGYGGQFIFVVPDLDMVVVTTSSVNTRGRSRSHLAAIYSLLEDYLVPAAAVSDALPAH